MLLCWHSFVDLVLKIVACIGQSRLSMCSMDIAAFLCFVLEISVVFMEMALKSSLWGEACNGNRSLAICLWNEGLVHYYEKKWFMVLSLASCHSMRLSVGYFKGEKLRTLGLNIHVFIPLEKMLIIALFFGFLTRTVKEYSNFLTPKLPKQRFKSARPKLHLGFNKAKTTGRDGRSWRYCKEEHGCGGSVRTFYVTSWGPLLLCSMGKVGCWGWADLLLGSCFVVARVWNEEERSSDSGGGCCG